MRFSSASRARRAYRPLRLQLQPRMRLAHRPWADRFVRRQAPTRVSALDRVMRRLAVQVRWAFAAHVKQQPALAATAVRTIQRVEVRPPGEREVRFHTLLRHDRFHATQRLLHERVRERLTHNHSPAAARLSFVSRIEQRHAMPPMPLTVLRSQAVVTQPASAGRTDGVPAPAPTRPLPAQPRFASAAPPLVLPPQELSRLTDHVIRELDHRVLSWQERTGRA